MIKVLVDEVPDNCIDCEYCITETSDDYEYSGMLHSNDPSDTYKICLFVKDILSHPKYKKTRHERCPMEKQMKDI